MIEDRLLYLVAHAPTEPQYWFKPVMTEERPELPADFIPSASDYQERAAWITWTHHRRNSRSQLDEIASPALRAYVQKYEEAESAQLAWDVEEARQKFLQWPLAWAKMIQEQLDGPSEDPIDRSLQLFAVPDGWKLVPVDPTMEMLNAADDVYTHSYTGTATAMPDKVYSAMLAAAPEFKS